MDINKAIEIIAGQDYPSITDLRYNQKLGHRLSKNEFLNFLKIKDELISKQENLFNPFCWSTDKDSVNVIRLSKYSCESVEEQVRTAPKQNLIIQTNNEKSKTKEACDPAGSRVQRPEGLKVRESLNVRWKENHLVQDFLQCT